MILVGGNDGFISVENILNTSNDEFDTKVGVFDKLIILCMDEG